MLKKIKHIIQKVKCSMPFSLNHFWHKNVFVVRELSAQSQLIQCRDCGQKFAINHDVQAILPWETVKSFYPELGQHPTRKSSGQEMVGDIWTNEDESAEIERHVCCVQKCNKEAEEDWDTFQAEMQEEEEELFE